MSSFFQKIGSFVSSAVGSKSKIPYDIEETEIGKSGLWSIRKAKKDEKSFSAFIFDKVKNRNRLEESLAQTEVKKLRALRHPGIVHYVFHHENEEQIVMITEALSLLNLKEETEISKLFGCYSILKALNFLHSNSMYHFHINPDAIFVDHRKMWKLGALGCLTKIEDTYSTPTEFPIHKYSQVIMKRYPLYRSPELNQKKWQILVRYPHATDTFSFGLLLFDVFEGAQIDHTEQITRSPLRSLPKSFRRKAMGIILHSNPSKRPSCELLLKNPAFKNEIFDIFEFVERVTVEQDAEVLERNLTNLWNNLDQFPVLYTQNRILPQLFHALLYGAGQLKKGADASNTQKSTSTSVQDQVTPQLKMYQIIFRIGLQISDSKVYRRIVIPPLYKILCSTDTMPIYHQIKVIEQIGQIVPHADTKFLKIKIFPILVSGLSQTRSSNLREACVKSVVPLIPMLDSQQQIIDILIPTFFNLLKCQKKSVRANAVIAVGMMTSQLAAKSKTVDQNLLDLFALPFFARTLKYDNFSYSKIYALKALKTTMGEYNLVQLCRSVLPIVSPWLISRNPEIREAAFDCFNDSQTMIRKSFDGGNVEIELNRILGVQQAPKISNPTSSSSSQAPSSSGDSSAKTGRIKNWASTLFLGKQAVEEESKEKSLRKMKEEEERRKKVKKLEEERKWSEDRNRREMEELKRNDEKDNNNNKKKKIKYTHTNFGNPIAAKVLGGPNDDEDEGEEKWSDDDDEYVQDFLKSGDSPVGWKPKHKSIHYNSNIDRNNKNKSKKKKSNFFPDLDEPNNNREFERAKSYNRNHATEKKKDNSNNEDWEIGWGDIDEDDNKNNNKKKKKTEDTDEDEVDWGEEVSWDDDDEIEEVKRKDVVKKTPELKIKKKNKKIPKKKEESGDEFEVDMGWGGFESPQQNEHEVSSFEEEPGDNNNDYDFWDGGNNINKKKKKKNNTKAMGMGSSNDVDENVTMSGDDFWNEEGHKKKMKKKKEIENEFEGLINFDDI